ncbi:DUF1295 domain-containing protein [Melghirimyces algeriensis]|uniref:Uncharacterized protein n=1 Tax=Melghirimyces algeriensis TaxID=910412 RepID=A0A521AHF8_9BACL|nr:DUF1295 domain-containing protein [Melghirimyces algeriensis]SMO34178.1 Protein of unknown function [Melghirimyces algeriensis]
MHGTYEQSLNTKVAWSLIHALSVLVVGWVLLGNGLEAILNPFLSDIPQGNPTRNGLLFFCSIVLFIRMNITGFVFIKRRFGWNETLQVGIWLWIIHLTFAILGGLQSAAISVWDWIGLGLFLFGSYLNTGSEWQRHQFKKKPDSKGQLFTKGLFRYSMHINYFGDVVWAIGFALLTHNPWAFLIPFIMLLSFIFFHIPVLDRYLSKRYGKQFEEYAQRTHKLIPFIY